MDRQTALRALGLPAHASPGAVRRSFAPLRDHLMARALGADSQRETAARLAELAALESALARDLADGRNRWSRLRLAAAAAVVLALAWALAWGVGRAVAPPGAVTAPGVPGEEPAPPVAAEGPPEAVPGPPAELAVSAAVEGARFALLAPEGETLLAAPADGAVHSFDPAPGGPLDLRVSHPDCAAGAAQVVELPPGAQLDLEVQPCPETGWLVVRSNVTGDFARAGPRDLGPTSPDLHPLPVGRYRVRVEKPGYDAWQRLVQIEPGRVAVVRATLRRAGHQMAGDDVQSEAARTAADITRDKGGTRGWFESVSTWMVAHHDADGSGLIDSLAEVDAIPCNTWQALEISYETGGLGAPMSRLYGFDGSRWVPEALGFDVRMRDEAYQRMRACGLR
jgi:hypothetical protein